MIISHRSLSLHLNSLMLAVVLQGDPSLRHKM
jgi:hypothetical protein